MATVKESLARIEAHEKECALRYENIEKRLDAGSKKFDRLMMSSTERATGNCNTRQFSLGFGPTVAWEK